MKLLVSAVSRFAPEWSTKVAAKEAARGIDYDAIHSAYIDADARRVALEQRRIERDPSLVGRGALLIARRLERLTAVVAAGAAIAALMSAKGGESHETCWNFSPLALSGSQDPCAAPLPDSSPAP